MKLGIFGGTFNPIHNGHVNLAVRCLEGLGLDQLLLIPTAIPPHKESGEIADSAHRISMCRLAVQAYDRISVSDLEMKRKGKSYTVDTLRILKTQYPEDELYLLVGSDMFYSMENWYCAGEVFDLVKIVAVAREADENERLDRHCEKLVQKGAAAQILHYDPVIASSSEIRENDREDTLLPAVLNYIQQNGLYGRPVKLEVDLDELTRHLRGVLSQKRFNHSLNVASEALRLADRYGANKEFAYVAGLLHDICKEAPKEEMLKILEGSDIILDKTFLSVPKIWHGYVAAIYIQNEFSILNAEIIDAVRVHSTGCDAMSLLQKIIYMADLISAERDYPGVEQMRALAYQSLDLAMLKAYQFIIGELISKGRPLLEESFRAYNYFALAAQENI